MDSFADIYYWIRLGTLGLLCVLAIIAAIRLARSRRFSVGRGITVALLALAGMIGAWFITGASPSPIWFVALLAAGAIIGYLAGRAAKPVPESGALKRSPFAAAATALTVIFAAMTLLFGTSYLFSIALLGLAFAAGALLGQLFAEMQVAKSAPVAGAGSAPPPMPVQAPPPMPTAAPPTSPAPPPMPGQPV